MALRPDNLDRAGIPLWHGLDILYQRGFVHIAAFFVEEHRVIGIIFLEWLLATRHDGVKQFSSTSHQFILRYSRFVCHAVQGKRRTASQYHEAKEYFRH